MRHWNVGLVVLGACGGTELVEVSDSEGQPIELRVGQEMIRTLGTVGPGSFASPPAISSVALTFVGMSYASVQVPSGPTQLFRFKAERTGTAIVTYTHTYSTLVVEDVVTVR